MKKLLLILFAGAVILSSCKKDDPSTPSAEKTADLEFQIEQTDFGGLKNTLDDVPECNDLLSMDYVVFEFAGVEYTSPIFTTMDGKILTKAVKLPVLEDHGTYDLTKFVIYHDVLPVGKDPGDIIVRAAPEPGATFHDLMVNKLDLEIEVEAFKKKEVIIDVLCFEDLYYEDFGFTWFELNKVKIERLCFFGDVCTGKKADFDVDGSYYQLQSQGVQMDMPAVMQVKVYKQDGSGDYGVPIRIFDNILDADGNGWYGEGACMEVYWANDEDLTEHFRFELYVQLPSGLGMDWILVDVFDFDDDHGPAAGTDGVVDFVLGNCLIDEADYQYPAWMDLPTAPFTMYVEPVHSPGLEGTYIDVVLSGLAPGYDIKNGTLGVWCGDQSATINPGNTYTVEAISSLMPIPAGFTLTPVQLNKLNYLFNNLPSHLPEIDLFDIAGYTSTHPGDWSEVQNAIWGITENNPPSGGMASAIYTDADANGFDYKVLPGQWAGIMFWVAPNVQVLFVMVDP